MDIENSFFEDSVDPEQEYQIHRNEFISHMDKLKSMTVHELTFYKKWQEIQGYRFIMSNADHIKSKIWKPTDLFNKDLTIQEISNMKPRIFYVNPSNESDMEDWLVLRLMCHTMAYDQSPGRFLRFLVIDDTTEKYLGAVSVSNDVMALTCRDEYIGWTRENRIDDGKLIHSAIGSCIMATQPFGYNFLGGKLVASLVTTDVIRNAWESVVGKKLVGLTTTSLYGPNSMYCGIPYWDGCGCSAGKISIKPDDKYYDFWHDYIKKNRSDEYEKKIAKKGPDDGPVTGIKQRILEIIFRELKISATTYNHGFKRGVYYSAFYNQTKDFLCGKMSDASALTLRDKFKLGSDGVISWWRKKAINRYTNLLSENRLKPEVLFYNKLVDMSYETAKSEYLSEVGR